MLNVICAYCHVMSIILTVVMLSVIDTNSGVASVKIWKIYAFIGINNVEKIMKLVPGDKDIVQGVIYSAHTVVKIANKA
jgi:hypothetical protein